jgi:hypothetical protein
MSLTHVWSSLLVQTTTSAHIDVPWPPFEASQTCVLHADSPFRCPHLLARDWRQDCWRLHDPNPAPAF